VEHCYDAYYSTYIQQKLQCQQFCHRTCYLVACSNLYNFKPPQLNKLCKLKFNNKINMHTCLLVPCVSPSQMILLANKRVVVESAVKFLSRAFQPSKLQLYDSSIRASANFSPHIAHSCEPKPLQASSSSLSCNYVHRHNRMILLPGNAP